MTTAPSPAAWRGEDPASRLSEEEIGGVKVIMQMSKDKNALACSRNFDYIR